MRAMSGIVLSFWRRRHVPLILQTEAAECGLACLCMVAGYWQCRIDLTSMRRRFEVSTRGITLDGLMRAARDIGLQPRPLRIDPGQLGALRCPCVLHWDANHFVVLQAIRGNRVTILDPATGPRRLTRAQAAQHCSGVALELLPGPTFQAGRETAALPLSGLTGRLTGLWRGLARLFGIGLTLQLCTMLMPFYLQWVVDHVLLTADHHLLAVLGSGFVMLVLLQGALGAMRSWCAAHLAVQVNYQWLGNVFSHLLRLPLPYFEKRRTGDIVSRFNSVHVIQQRLTTQFVESLLDGMLVVGTLLMMLSYSPMLTGVVLLVTGLYIGSRCVLNRPMHEACTQQIDCLAAQQTHFLESIRGMQSLRLFDRCAQRGADWMNCLARQLNAELDVARLTVGYQTCSAILFGLERIAVIWLAALAVLDGRFSVGMLFAFISYKDQFSQRMATLIDRLFDLRLLRLHADRLRDIVCTEAEPTGESGARDCAVVAPSVTLRNLSFRYGDDEPLVLRSVDLTIAAGECVAITGESGCGKTTLVKLLVGLRVPTGGDILVNGVRVQNGTGRHMIGTVMQGDQLFAGSLAANISFFDSSQDDELVQSCARLAAIHDDIVQMPMGYDTLVGEMGAGLSGGQQQRILLARALYKQPGLLVLDEATSHLDLHNERLVNRAIRSIPLTRLIVAHRPDTIAMADRVIVLQEGAVVDDRLQYPVTD